MTSIRVFIDRNSSHADSGRAGDIAPSPSAPALPPLSGRFTVPINIADDAKWPFLDARF